MSYRCDICGIKVPPKQQRLVHQVRYPRKVGVPHCLQGQVKQELSCCNDCHMMLDDLPLSSVKDPYYLRPKEGTRTTITVLTELPDQPIPDTSRVGSLAKTVTL